MKPADPFCPACELRPGCFYQMDKAGVPHISTGCPHWDSGGSPSRRHVALLVVGLAALVAVVVACQDALVRALLGPVVALLRWVDGCP